MTSPNEISDVTNFKEEMAISPESKDLTELPPSGTSLHKRRRGEPPATLTVKSPQTPSDAEGSSPCTVLFRYKLKSRSLRNSASQTLGFAIVPVKSNFYEYFFYFYQV